MYCVSAKRMGYDAKKGEFKKYHQGASAAPTCQFSCWTPKNTFTLLTLRSGADKANNEQRNSLKEMSISFTMPSMDGRAL